RRTRAPAMQSEHLQTTPEPRGLAGRHNADDAYQSAPSVRVVMLTVPTSGNMLFHSTLPVTIKAFREHAGNSRRLRHLRAVRRGPKRVRRIQPQPVHGNRLAVPPLGSR